MFPLVLTLSLLAGFFRVSSCQPLIIVSEGDVPGKILRNYTCGETHSLQITGGIREDFFKLNQTGNQVNLILSREIDLENTTDFPNATTTDCLSEVREDGYKVIITCNTIQTIYDLRLNAKNEFDPYFCAKNCSKIENVALHVPENTTVGTTLLDLNICDKDVNSDQSQLMMQVKPGTYLTDANKKTFKLRTLLDYESGPRTINSYASLNGKRLLDISITVTDSDDLGIAFEKHVFKCFIPENHPQTVTNCSVIATDLDKGINTPVSYELLSVTPNSDGLFELLSNGSFRLKKQIDREKVPVYYLSVKGFQVDRPDKINYTTVLVTVTDIDDNSPEMTQAYYDANVVENSPIGTPVCQVSATDKDEGEHAQFHYQIVGDNTFFKVDSSTGSITVKASIDREMSGSNPIQFQVHAVSVKTASSKSTVSNVTVHVLDENDNSPKFAQQYANITIEKTQPLNTTFHQINATDTDEGENGKVTYKLENIDSPFHIDSNNGMITLKRTLNESFDPLYSLVVIAKDNAVKVQDRRSCLGVVKVEVTDVNIHAPQFFLNLPTNIDISEDARVGTTVMELKAADKDPTDSLLYTVENANGVFTIEDKYLKTATTLDRENEATYHIVIAVNDKKHISRHNLTVEVTDVNDNGPVFKEQQYVFNITEEKMHSNFGSVSASDLDKDLNGNVVYEIDAESKWSKFFIVDKTTGSLATKMTLDRELLSSGEIATFLVFAFDRGQPERMNSTVVKVNILDVNDNGPTFDSKQSTVHYGLKEGSQPANFHKAQAVDADGKDFNNIYYKLNETSLQHTVLVTREGTVSLRKKLNFSDANGCNRTCVRFTIEAYNEQKYTHNNAGKTGTNDTQTIIVDIKDVNEKPYFNVPKEATDMSFPERNVRDIHQNDWHQAPPMKYTYLAHDNDVESKFKNIVYTFTDPSGKFSFNSSSGKIFQKRDIDFDPPANETRFKLYLKASNKYPLESGNEASSTLEINVKITDVDDNAPKFRSDQIVCKVKENTTGPIKGCFVDAFDKDLQPNTNITLYTDTLKTFEVTNSGQIQLLNTLNYETSKQINITVSATPEKTVIQNVCGMKNSTLYSKSCTAKCSVTINVLNVNDIPPHFEHKVYNFTVTETNETDLVIGQVSAVDLDGDINELNYYLSSYTFFNIDGDGYIRSNKALDFEQNTEHVFTVIVNDTLFTDQASVRIHILPVNEFTPVFSEDFRWTVIENETVEKQISAVDHDNGEQSMTFRANIPSKWVNDIALNTSNGTMRLSTINREGLGNNDTIQFTVEAIDGGNPPRTGIAMVIITVTGVDDNPPVYLNGTTNITLHLLEGKAYDNIYISKAYDADIGPGSEILYRLLAGETKFNIGRTSGILSSKRQLFITPANSGSLNVEIQAYNANGTQGVSVQRVTILLQDINNHKPVFAIPNYRKNISECMKAGTKILSVSATDADTTAEFNTVFYWLEQSNDTFYVGPDTGSIYLTGNIDYDLPANQNSIAFNVYATDDLKSRNKSISTRVTLEISNCNDNAPVFTSGIYWCHIFENTVGNFNCSAVATDADGDTLSYRIHDQPRIKEFSISSSTGSLSAVAAIDYDTIKSKEYTINVTANDGNHTRFATVIVKVLDVNDERPTFKNNHYAFNIKENVKDVSYYVGEVNVSDADSEFSLSINDCFFSCKGCFHVNEKGDIVALQEFDYESSSPNHFTCEIAANDTLSNVKKNISIQIIDVNDNTPTFTNNPAFISVNETAKAGTFVTQLAAIDHDKSSEFNQVSYNISGGNELGLFRVDSENGSVFTENELVEHFGENVTVMIQACDNGYPQLCGYSHLTIKIKNLNIHQPVFMGTPYHVQIKEGNGNVTVLQVHAEDKDGDKLHYKVLNKTSTFYFQNNVLYAHALDAEAFQKSSGLCSVQIQVSDGLHVVPTTVVVTVIDVNDNAPRLVAKSSKGYTVKVNDTTKVGKDIYQFNVHDNDISNEGFTYILHGGRGDFEINQTTGNVIVVNKFGNNGKSYNISVIVMDHGDPPKSDSSVLHVEVIDTYPHFDFKAKHFIVNLTEESTSEHTSLAVVGDNSPVNNVDYQIISGNKIGILDMFSLDYSTGLLTLANTSKTLNYEKQSKYEFTLSAKDRGVFQKTAVTNVTINVIDVNEKPKITSSELFVLIEENSPANTFISRFQTSDPDINEPFNNFTFTMSDNQNFKADADGTITVKAGHLKAGSYSLAVTVTDGGHLSDTVTITIVVPSIRIHSFNMTLKENNSVPYFIKKLETTVGGMIVEYTVLQSTYSGIFLVTSNMRFIELPLNMEIFKKEMVQGIYNGTVMGSLMLNDVIDREIIESVTIHVNGRHTLSGILLTKITVVINVEDINDCSPGFLLRDYIITINDLASSDTVIAKIAAIDGDIDDNNKNLTYELIGSKGLFLMDRTGNLKVLNSSQLQTKTYVIVINVTDGRFHNRASLTINVIDTNDHSPIFSATKYNFNILETNQTGITVGSVVAHDTDSGRNGKVTFSITAGDTNTAFKINGTSGLISTVRRIDREHLNKYQLIITAKDNGNNPRQGTCTVMVDVLDVNDNTPKLQVAFVYTASILENSKENTNVIVTPDITATDADFGVHGSIGLVYKLNDTTSPFCIAQIGSQASIHVCGDIDRELQDTYYLEVIVLDSNGSSGSHSASAPLKIHVLDENDEAPQFTEKVYRFNVSENTDVSMIVGNVSVTDRDLNGNKDTKFGIAKGDETTFHVDTYTGIIYAGGNIDREKESEYKLYVTASDGINVNFVEVIIHVSDVNDNPPVFSLVVVDVVENRTGIIFNAAIHDADDPSTENSRVTFLAESQDNRGVKTQMFAITKDGGLHLTSPLDRETSDHYEVKIIATDTGSPALSSSLILYINVLDINDNHPVICVDGKCGIPETDIHISSNTPASSVLKILGSRDPDAGSNGTVTFSLMQSVLSNYFETERYTGVVRIVNPQALYKTLQAGNIDSNDWNVKAIALDGGGQGSNVLKMRIVLDP